jgi:hypothetical protein
VEINQSATSVLTESEKGDLSAPPPEKCGITSVCDHLQLAEKLLLNPTAQAVALVGSVLQEAQLLLKGDLEPAAVNEKRQEFEATCTRLKALVEGALRAQWAYIHRISCATSTYTPGPGTKRWNPPASTLSLEA